MSTLDLSSNRAPGRPSQRRGAQDRRPGRAALALRRHVPVIVLCVLLAFAVPSAALAGGDDESTGTRIGLITGSVLGSALYLPMKLTYAVVGLPVAGLTWVFTLGDGDATEKVFVASTRGDYLVLPHHLRGPDDVQLVGRMPQQPQVYARASGALPDVSAPVSAPGGSAVDCRDLQSLPQVHFAFDDAEIRSDAASRLDYVAATLRRCPDLDVLIEGHTDSIGAPRYNVSLSQRRADAVKQYLVERGVAASRLRSEGLGETRPYASNETSLGRAENRRAELPLILR